MGMTFYLGLLFPNFQKQINKQKINPKLRTVIIKPIMDGFQILRCLQKHIDILLGTTVSKFPKTNNQINPKLQTVIIKPNMDGFQMLRYLQKHIDILLGTTVSKFPKTNKQTNK